MDQGRRIASASGCHRSPLPLQRTQLSALWARGNRRAPPSSNGQLQARRTCAPRPRPPRKLLPGLPREQEVSPTRTGHSCKGHIAIPVAAFPLRTSRIVPCFETSLLYCSRPGRLPLRKKRRLRFASDILSPQGWDTLCTIPRDRARQLSVLLSPKSLISLTPGAIGSAHVCSNP